MALTTAMATLLLCSATAVGGALAVAEWNASCPDRCLCHIGWSHTLGDLLRTVSCRDGSFSAPPPNLPAGVQKLVITGSDLSDLASLVASSATLAELDVSGSQLKLSGLQSVTGSFAFLRAVALDDNRLTSLPSGVFGGPMARVERLDLAGNGVVYAEDGAFSGLLELKSLNLQRNKLARVRASWFDGLGALEKLDLSGNLLGSLPPALFANLRALRSLSLAGNRIASLYGDARPPGPAPLEELYLQNNLLRSAPDLSPFAGLKILKLDANPLAELAAGALGAPALLELTLTGMTRLAAIGGGAFANCSSLRVLRASGNPRLSYVDEAAFRGLGNLTHLHLHDCALRVLPSTVLDHSPKLEEVSVYGNPLQCGCHAAWIQRIMNASSESSRGAGIRFVDGDKIVCDSPPFRSGLTLASLTLAELLGSCSPVVFPSFGATRAVSLGDDVELACKAVGASRLFWRGCENRCNATVSGGDATARSTELALKTVRIGDDGVYSCIAVDENNGSDSATVHLLVIRSRLYISAVSVSSEAVLVRLSPLQEREGCRYALTYRVAGAARADTASAAAVDAAEEAQHLNVGGLLPNTEYEMCVALYKGQRTLDERCVTVVTQPQRPKPRRLESSVVHWAPAASDRVVSSPVIVASACLAAALFAACCVVGFVIRRRVTSRTAVKYHRRADDRIAVAAADMLANRCYNPTTAPLCASNMAFA